MTQQLDTSTFEPSPATHEKHGSLFGGALTEEALDSSRKVLSRHRGVGSSLVGLQQWFMPLPAGQLIAAVFGRPAAVLDPTAGAGDLLAPYPQEARFGIEIDPDHIGFPSGVSFNAVQGDAQAIVPMLRAAGARFPAVAMNPPFGLSWRDPIHARGEINSTVLAYLWAMDLLDYFGQGALVCGRDRLRKEILSRKEGGGIYAIVDVDGPLFDGVALPTSIAFFVRPHNREKPIGPSSPNGSKGSLPPVELSAAREELPDLALKVVGVRSRLTRHVSTYYSDARALRNKFEAVAREHERRRKQRASKKPASRFDLDLLKANKVRMGLSAYAKLALAEAGSLREIELLSGQHTSYFAQNTRAWRQVEAARDKGLLSVSPTLEERVAGVLEEAERQSTPLLPVKPQQRLGWLTDLERIRCKKDDQSLGFLAGEDYSLSTHSKVVTETERRLVEKKNGDSELRQFEKERKLLAVRIGKVPGHTFDESSENIEYLTTYFELPDPGCVATRFPEAVTRNRRILEEIAKENGFAFKDFQLNHLSRLLVKQRGMVAMEQGLGKTLCLMALAEATVRLGAKDQILFVAPQDLLGQWSREAKKFFGRKIEEIRTPTQARNVARRVKAGEKGWWITYFEAMSIVSRKHEVLPHVPLDHRDALGVRLEEYKRNKRQSLAGPGHEATTLFDLSGRAPRRQAATPPPPVSHDEDEELEMVTTRVACPECRATTYDGWNGEVCRDCGYVHRRLLVKSAYSHLTRAFKNGVKCVDEVSEIRGDDSLRSNAIRAIAAGPHNYGATGTPLSNYINDSFWGLWFCLGNARPAFPYSHTGGKAKFETDFCVIEYMNGREEDDEEHLRKRRKILPQVTNVSQFWRLVQPGVSRCRKEQTGESLVERTYHPIRVPMGVGQAKANAFWLKTFEDYFVWQNPDHPMAVKGLVEKWAAALGQLWRLETAATLPASDEPSKEWPKARVELGELSNWTPANLKVLELAMEHAAKGEKVLIGSDLIMTGKWLAQRLCEKGVRAVHITEERSGKVGTKNPRKRAREVEQFVNGDAQVLCAGIGAMKLGHNLDVASTVIVHGLPYSFMSMDQFIARVHRLTSKHPVSIYVVIPRGSLAERKWTLLKDKGGASDLAFDGELSVQPEKPIDWNKVLKEMKERGIRSSGDEVLEADVKAEWEKIAPLIFYPPPRTPAPVLSTRAAENLPLPEGEYVQAALF